MEKLFAVGITIFAANLLAGAASANDHSADLQHSSRVLYLSNVAAPPEIDYENRGLTLGQPHFASRPDHQNDQLAIASFGTSTAADTVTGLLVYFNFNNSASPFESDTTYGLQHQSMFAVSYHSSNGTTVNAASGDIAGNAEGFLTNSVSPEAGFEFVFNGPFVGSTPGSFNMVVSFATAGQPGGSATQSFSYSTNDTEFVPLLPPIVGTTDSGWQRYSFVVPATLDNAQHIYINDDITLDPGSTSATTLLDNVRVDLAPVPEPSTWAGAGLAAVVIGWMQRRRLLALVGIG